MTDFAVMIAAGVLFIFFAAGRNQRLNRLKGIILLSAFTARLISLLPADKRQPLIHRQILKVRKTDVPN